MRKVIILLLVLIIPRVYAQDRVQVLDSIYLKPLSNVSITVHNIGTTTDNDGFFSLKVFSSLSESDSIAISCIGYNTIDIDLSTLNKSKIVYLTPKEERLKDVTILGKKVSLKSYVNFKELASMPHGVFSFGAVVANGNIYVIGGDRSIKDECHDYYLWENNSDRIQIYDIENNKWSLSKLKLSSRAYHNAHYYNNRIFIIGGKRLARNPKLEYLNDIVEVYDLKKDTIISSKTNPHQAVNFASSTYKDNIIVMGGSTKQNRHKKNYSSKIYSFNLKSGFWYDLGNMPFTKETKGIAIDSIFYLVGGFQNKPIKYINSYNISTGEHKVEFRMPGSLERPALACHNNVIYIFESGLIFTFNVLTKEMYAYQTQLGLKYSELVYDNGLLYIIGGLEYDESRIIPSDKIYSVDISEFDKIDSYPVRNLNSK